MFQNPKANLEALALQQAQMVPKSQFLTSVGPLGAAEPKNSGIEAAVAEEMVVVAGSSKSSRRKGCGEDADLTTEPSSSDSLGAFSGSDTEPNSANRSSASEPDAELELELGDDESERLQHSVSSWSARQRDAACDSVMRSIKSILNKLTWEKFPQLYRQLTECGIRCKEHVAYLIQEVFEKATTQHHFIDLYADLCALLHEHFAMFPLVEEAKFSFKRALLGECQASFERYLVPPERLEDAGDFEERTLQEVRYKTCMLGNIRLVGALLTRKMLAAKIFYALAAELLQDPTPEALETLAALLTVVGPAFDHAGNPGRPAMTDIFHQVELILQKPTCKPRVRCLLQDLLDFRAGGWRGRKPQRKEGPSTLTEAALRAAEGGSAGRQHSTQLQFVDEVRHILRELQHSFDEVGAASRLAGLTQPPPEEQAPELSRFLAEVCQEADAGVRRAGFRLAARLFSQDFGDSRWVPAALGRGLDIFAAEVSEDLKVDVPGLGHVLRDDLAPAIAPALAATTGDVALPAALQALIIASEA